ncbi:hypothetical protein DTO013E5_3947 [Penicillium roqueforti]|uniref:Phospholipid/glycerol acyltransferase n=1 Tax=Penicillium roqueforti (strain FM164) TaxID=1365484 RepID=W6PWF1_PENRF|nr:uncharacterized protein LCP9604111_1622 [Penicillium roqueforti]CDM28131.1 Phospholipid/glycerol acyltransferase [Penicillium roqueforti FM164]KAF9251626.1 hypothetical protein LCP9604111_1622 [Penicillium roqueforti]KAI1836561.1 hypothetical protein CBS147337_2788 [Penicillium roqueforti]KAI2685301.1 hypothetical protein LCP963914a_4628 [Penicillium roqueforti]KAI2690349.1 hypothetical protein CBS147355_800 [Penicillium roqueforti]
MESAEVRQRKPPTANLGDLQQLSTKPPSDPRLKHGIPMQLLRSLLLMTWVDCCIIAICVTQVIGSPLYLINKRYYYSYMAYTKQSFGLVLAALTEWSSPTLFRVSGDASVRGQIHLSKDGLLETRFPERLVLISNHQVYTDWVYLWWVAYTNQMHGRLFIILKESLKYIPLVGTGMMFYGFIFMARKWTSDKPRLEHRLQKLKTVYGGSNSARPQYDPMWLLIFPEGTNLSTNTKRRSDIWGQKQGLPSFKHVILPRSTGLLFCLQQLRGTVDWVYDCTIAYEGPPKGSYPDKYFTLRSTYLQGRPPTSVNMHWRRFNVSEIPLDDQKEFEDWLTARWAEKDQLMDQYFETGRFPSELAGSIKADNAIDGQLVAATAGYVESYGRLRHWSELGLIFGVLLSVALLCKFVTSWVQG